MKTILVFFSFLFLLSLQVNAQTISAARSQPIGNVVTVQGTVLNGSELGIIRYIQDATGGIGIYDGTGGLGSVNRGDIITVTGTLFNFNNLLEISPVSSFNIVSTGNPLPAVQTITISQFGEIHEGELIGFNNISFVQGGSTFSGNMSYTFTDGVNTSSIYVRNGSPLVGQTIPTGTANVIGIGSQFSSNYQLLIRDMNDITLLSSINITSPLTCSNFSSNSITLNWTTDASSTTQIRYGLTPALELGTVSGIGNVTSHEVLLNNLLPGNIYFCKAVSTAGNDTAISALRTFGTISNSSGNIKCYFNDFVNTNGLYQQAATTLFNAIDDTLIAYIDRAELSLDMTIYDFNNTNISNISNAINAAHNRGVVVRFISDGSLASSNSGVSDLLPAIPRIQSPTGGTYGIMHNKFVVIDAKHPNPLKPVVWTGATNWTQRQINTDPNDVIILQDQTLARAYTLEFEEMWGSSGPLPDTSNAAFGPDKSDNTPHEFVIGGKRVEQYFSPSDATNTKLISTISGAASELYIASMLITRVDIANAIAAARNGGALVQAVVDDATTTTIFNGMVNFLGASNFVANQDTSVIMHHKYMVVDQINPQSDPLVWTGSHNWTNNANNRNDENVVVVHDRNIANQYYQNFNARLAENGGIILTANNTPVQPITIFPNPASSALYINYASESAPSQYSLMDLSGRVVYSGNFSLAASGTEKISLSGIPGGIYMLRFDFDKQASCTYRIIKTQ
ncbi:MAG: phospholipase D-like domain-containing protein [Bacteroidota bacterium]|jgi:hypothetical protein